MPTSIQKKDYDLLLHDKRNACVAAYVRALSARSHEEEEAAARRCLLCDCRWMIQRDDHLVQQTADLFTVPDMKPYWDDMLADQVVMGAITDARTQFNQALIASTNAWFAVRKLDADVHTANLHNLLEPWRFDGHYSYPWISPWLPTDRAILNRAFELHIGAKAAVGTAEERAAIRARVISVFDLWIADEKQTEIAARTAVVDHGMHTAEAPMLVSGILVAALVAFRCTL
jgi:hypothetical protein